MPVRDNFIPCFGPPVGYKYRISPNAAWVGLKPSSPQMTGRCLLPPSPYNPGLTTSWGTPMPIWRPGHEVLVRLGAPCGTWNRAIVLDVLPPCEIEKLSVEELDKIPSHMLDKWFCRYTVRLVEEGVNGTCSEIEADEKVLVPTFMDSRLKANAVKFGEKEQVLVQMLLQGRRRTFTGQISSIFGDQVVRAKGGWHVVPRLYQVYLNELETFGHWTAKSIFKIEPPARGARRSSSLPPPSSVTKPQTLEV